MMNELKGARDLTMLGLGGQFYNWCNAFHRRGDDDGNPPPARRPRLPFLLGDHRRHGLPPVTEMVETKRAMFESAAMRILLADHTKFERRALHSMTALEYFDVVIVDDGTPHAELERMRARGVRVIVAPVDVQVD